MIAVASTSPMGSPIDTAVRGKEEEGLAIVTARVIREETRRLESNLSSALVDASRQRYSATSNDSAENQYLLKSVITHNS